jgi:hypothetical protein
MHVRDIRLAGRRAKLLGRAVGDHRQALVAENRVAQVHLDIGKELVFGYPAVAVVDLQMTEGGFHDGPGRGCRHPGVGGILSEPHVDVRGKIQRAAIVIIVRAIGQALGAVIEPVVGDPRLPLLPGQLEHVRGRQGA